MKRGTPKDFAAYLRSHVALKFPEGVKRGMVEGGLYLGGPGVQNEIASTQPIPVDMGQYKAAWTTTELPDGIVVGNTSKQSTWIERGRLPGPVPLKPILEWVQRKQIATGQGAYLVALKIRNRIAASGYAPRWVLKRALTALFPRLRKMIKASVAEEMGT